MRMDDRKAPRHFLFFEALPNNTGGRTDKQVLAKFLTTDVA